MPDQTVKLLLKYADHWNIPQPPADAELIMLLDAELAPPANEELETFLDNFGTAVEESANSDEVRILDRMGNPMVPLKDPAGKRLPLPRTGRRFQLGFRAVSSTNVIFLGFAKIDFGNHCDLVITNEAKVNVDDMLIGDRFGRIAHDYNCALITAVQMLRRDSNSELGRLVLSHALRVDEYATVAELEIDHPIARLSRAALVNEINRITTPAPDFRSIKINIERIWENLGPYTKETWSGDPSVQKLIERLNLTVNHPQPDPASIEAIVERYLISGANPFPAWGEESIPTQARVEMVHTGFAAVPILIELLEDNRITNHRRLGVNNMDRFPMTVSEVAYDYLGELSCTDLREPRQPGDPTSARLWYENARKIGEEQHIRENCFTKYKDPVYGDCLQANQALLLLAERRFPKLLPLLYRRMLKESYHSDPLVQAIVRTTGLTPTEKVDLLDEGIATNQERHTAAAERAIEEIGKLNRR